MRGGELLIQLHSVLLFVEDQEIFSDLALPFSPMKHRDAAVRRSALLVPFYELFSTPALELCEVRQDGEVMGDCEHVFTGVFSVDLSDEATGPVTGIVFTFSVLRAVTVGAIMQILHHLIRVQYEREAPVTVSHVRTGPG